MCQKQMWFWLCTGLLYTERISNGTHASEQETKHAAFVLNCGAEMRNHNLKDSRNFYT